MKSKWTLFGIFGFAVLLARPDAAKAQFTCITNNGAITITSGYGASGAIVIPSTITGLPVTSIGNYAFIDCYALTNVTIPSTVTNLGLGAFEYCNRLTAIYFQGNAPATGYGFVNENLTIYYQPGTSGWGAQYGGRPTVMLNPPSPAGSLQVTLAPTAAIAGGMRWQVDDGIDQPSGATVLGLSVGNHTVTFSARDGWALPAGQTVVVSADSTATTRGTYGQLTYTTNNGAITITWCDGDGGSMVLPGTITGRPVTCIGAGAFNNCTSVTNLTIPNSVTNIGNNAFANCSRLREVYFSGNAPETGYPFPFQNGLTVYYQPGTSGWSSRYGGCAAVMVNSPVPAGSLKVALAPAAAISAGAHWQVDGGLAQFSGATVLGLSVGTHTVSFTPVNGWATLASQNINVSDSSTSTVSVTYGQLTYTTNNGQITITQYTHDGSGVVLPSILNGWPVTGIANCAFYNCTGLNSVIIPSSITRIGFGPFEYCTALASITVDPANPYYSSTNGILFNKRQTELIQFPGGVSGSYTIPQNVTNVGTGAFAGCFGLTNVIIGPSLTRIGDAAFAGCGLTSVTIPNSVTNLGGGAFEDCGRLTTVTLPANLTSIAFFAFSRCYALTGVYFQGNAPTLDPGDSETFYYDTHAIAYYLPGTMGWETFDATSGLSPAQPWLPKAGTDDGAFGLRNNQFGFNITWASDKVVVVDACTNLDKPVWISVGTNTLTGGTAYFSDPDSAIYPARCYRLRPQ